MKKDSASKKDKPLKKGAIPHLFLILGFFGATLTAEVVNLLHEWTKRMGDGWFFAYSLFIVFVAWPYLMLEIIRAIEHLYSYKPKWWQFWR